MIKNFDTYKDVDNRGVITEYIVGHPSGEVLDINENEFVILKGNDLIRYNKIQQYFNFKDSEYDKIKKIIRKPVSNRLIEDYMKVFGIISYKINPDLSVDVNGNVDISGRKFDKIPIKFGKIYGNFDCSGNKLTNLVNSPNEVNGYFDCSINNLYTLIGGPENVQGGYYASDNNLEDLQGFPIICKTSFDCSRNNIITLKGIPHTIETRFFDVSFNKLRSLAHGPKKMKGFDCSHNAITTLMNGPTEVNGIFTCTFNRLTNLMGMPSCNKIIYEEGNKIEVDYDN